VRLIALDRYHLGDPLFARQLARALRGASAPLLLVHDSGEEGERALEALGVRPERRGGALVAETAEQQALVERAVRETGRAVAHELTEEGVPAVRLTGAERGLLRREAGALRVGRPGWLADLAARGAVPVVGGLAEGEGGGGEVAAASAAAALAAALEGVVVVLARDTRAGLRRGGLAPEAIGAADLTDRDVPDAAAVRGVTSSGVPVYVAPLGALGDGGRAPGVRVTPGEGAPETPISGPFIDS
jgi:acetylglutamate kinase